MAQIGDHAAEYETVSRLSEMLGTAKEDFKTTESYALFTTIVCWVMQRARTPADRAAWGDVQAREVGIALQGSRISDAPWLIEGLPEMTACDFFISVRNAVAHGDGRKIRPINENNILVGQVIPIAGADVELRRHDMRRLGQGLADLFCEKMVRHELEGRLEEWAGRIEPQD